MGREVFGVTIPLHVLFPTRPTVQFFDPDLKAINFRMYLYLQHNTFFGLACGYETYVPMIFDREEVDLSFALFETFGSDYDPNFKDKARELIKAFVMPNNWQQRKL